MKVFEQAIEKRNEMIEETGFKLRGDNHLEEQLKVALSRHAEMHAKMDKRNDSKRLLQMELERNADVKMKSWQMVPKKSEKKVTKEPKRRSTRK